MSVTAFRYCPDPVAAGSAVSTDEACGLCGVQRGIRYYGPVYGRQPGVLCLHCIQSGKAARLLGDPVGGPAMFSDAVEVPDDVPIGVVDEVVQRTPGFHAWQEGHWLYHCAPVPAAGRRPFSRRRGG